MNTKIAFCVVLFLSGCATPTTVLKNPHTGELAVCGGSSVGSVAGGLIGYSIQKSHDEDCVSEHKSNGFGIIKHSDE